MDKDKKELKKIYNEGAILIDDFIKSVESQVKSTLDNCLYVIDKIKSGDDTELNDIFDKIFIKESKLFINKNSFKIHIINQLTDYINTMQEMHKINFSDPKTKENIKRIAIIEKTYNELIYYKKINPYIERQKRYNANNIQ